MSVWNDKLIVSALQPGRGTVPPIAWVPEDRLAVYGPIAGNQIQPASLDVRLSHDFVLHPSGERVENLEPGERFALVPGQCVLATIVERVAIPDDVVARVEGKSSWARQFLTVHSAGFIDPGFNGDITLELKNDGHVNVDMASGDLIAQISFQWLAAPAGRPYGTEGLESHYQGQIGATSTWR